MFGLVCEAFQTLHQALQLEMSISVSLLPDASIPDGNRHSTGHQYNLTWSTT
jgi:hypothetical protein